MFDAPRLARVASVALAAGLVVACVGPGHRSATRRGTGPVAGVPQEKGPATLPIAGVVRDPQGRAIPAVWIEVEGFPETLKSPPPWRTDVHGRFQTDAVPEGPATLLVKAGHWPRSTPTSVVRTTAGARDLVIVLDPGPQLFLRIVGYVPGEQERWARVTWVEPNGARKIRYAPIRADGWVRFVALPPDRELELWAEAESDRRHVRARGLKPAPDEQRIGRHEVMDIAGKIRGPVRRSQDLSVTVDVYAHFPDVRVARVRPKADGSFRVRGLPPGTYEVDVGSRMGEIFSVSKRVEAGTTDAIFDLD